MIIKRCAQNDYGNIPLHSARNNDAIDIVQLLDDNSAKVNTKNSRQRKRRDQ